MADVKSAYLLQREPLWTCVLTSATHTPATAAGLQQRANTLRSAVLKKRVTSEAPHASTQRWQSKRTVCLVHGCCVHALSSAYDRPRLSRSRWSHIENTVDAQLFEKPPIFGVNATPDEEVLQDTGGPLVVAARAAHRALRSSPVRLALNVNHITLLGECAASAEAFF